MLVNSKRKHCELCQRQHKKLTVHHLVPRQAVKRGQAESGPTALLCPACHKMVHNRFSNKDLTQNYNSIKALLSDDKIRNFVRWLAKQDPNRSFRVKRSR